MIPQDMLQGLSRLGVAVNNEARMSAVKDVLQLTSCSNLYIRHAMKQVNKPNRHLPGLVVASCNDNIFNMLMPFGTLKQKEGLNSNGSSTIGADQI